VLRDKEVAKMIEDYRSDTTVRVLAEQYRVHKKKLKRHGLTDAQGRPIKYFRFTQWRIFVLK
jgi:hypothetical protein